MSYLYVLSKDSDAVRSRTTDLFQQNGNDDALIENINGSHPTKFKTQFNQPSGHVSCSDALTLSTMFNIPTPKSKLTKGNTRVPYFCNELSALLISDIMDIFTPQ